MLAVLVILAEAFPQLKRDSYPAPSYSAPARQQQQNYRQGESSSAGRVKIQVYRGPSKEGASRKYAKQDDGSDSSFAPWGFYVTQPEDNLG